MKLIPDSLFGRLVIILVVGMLAAQIATSSIWFDIRHRQALEIPARLVASRLADLIRVSARNPQQVDSLIQMLESPDLHLSLQERPSDQPTADDPATQPTVRLLNKVLREKIGHPESLRVLRLALVDHAGSPARLPALLSARPTVGLFLLELQLPDGRWLRVDAREAQGWSSKAPGDLVLDYVLRIYLLRILLVVLLALVAVRLAIRPLTQLTEAARKLGKNIQRPPLPLDGPLEVRRAAEAFNLMQQRLIASLAERTRFLAAVSHDLRSPITRMRLRTELLGATPIREHLRRDLEEMEQMVTSTLDFVASGEVNEQRLNIEINALLQSLQSDFQDLGVSIPIHGAAHAPLPGYARSLKRCVHNLLENAVRYGRQVDIAVLDDEQWLQIQVRDQGPGIPEALLQQVLEPFYRVDESRNAATGGFGLGLSIAHSVAQAHGGRLQLENRPEGGLQASLYLPRAVL
ncbi:HAMP domain-containing protein [Pseudomonas sp. NFXW11]|uniref:ATP-binding protein n=1 Tax=Pseudomonas sp. NFXW11 TaxID=2819531 RepID=UPI003CF29092